MLAATFLALFRASSSQAVSITYNTGTDSNINFTRIFYKVDKSIAKNTVGYSWITQPKLLQRGGTKGLRNLLQQSFPDWRFLIAPPKSGNYSLTGEFKIDHYYACGPNTACGNPSLSPALNGVGALFDVNFIPGAGDPQFPDRINWIQRIVSNHSEEPPLSGTHGLKEDRIDIGRRTDTPYYWPTANQPNFFRTDFKDRPYRPDPEKSHYWNAELYLIREIGNRTVMIYDGISWGWRNQTFRRRDDDRSCPAFPIISAAYGGDPGPGPGPEPCPIQENSILPDINEQGWQFFNNSPSLTTIQNHQASSSNTSQSVPEPSLNVGLLVLGIWSVRTLSQKKAGVTKLISESKI